jgi:hypothetical protein
MGLGVLLFAVDPVAADVDGSVSNSMREKRRPQSSPRRMPVVMTSQTRVPQSSSMRKPFVDEPGGFLRGRWVRFGWFGRGRRATRAGLASIQPHRSVAESVPADDGVDWRTVDAASGLHVCGVQLAVTQSCAFVRRVAFDEGFPVAACAAAAQLGVEAFQGMRVELADADLAEGGPDVALDVVDVGSACAVLVEPSPQGAAAFLDLARLPGDCRA